MRDQITDTFDGALVGSLKESGLHNSSAAK